MDKLTDLSSRIFLEKLASDAPVPGGGGAAAMIAAMAAALASMVANLTIGKEKFAANETEVKELLAQAEAIRENLLALTEADAAVFKAFMDCYKLPKNTDEEKQARSAAVQAAAKKAAEVPLAIAREGLHILKIAARITAIGNPNVVTDGAVSALAARAAVRSAAYNVLINLKLTKDESYNEKIIQELNVMQKEAEVLENESLQFTDNVLK